MTGGLNRLRHFSVMCVFVVMVSVAIGCGSALPASTGVASEAVNVMDEPAQIPVAGITPIVRETPEGRFTLTPVAGYRVSALVVSRREYDRGWNADLSPVDLALAWGPLTEPRKLGLVRFRQGNRWYFYRYGPETPFGNRFVAMHSSNHHIIPACENVARAVKHIRKGDRVTLEGYLVNVDGRYKNGRVWWRSSLSRSDTGDGACELMLVKRVQLGQLLYE